jgi:hypothetical protein
MKLKRLVLCLLSLSPSLAVAHPGHEAPTLHLHVGAPTALNSIDPTLIASGLFVASIVLAVRLLKGR